MSSNTPAGWYPDPNDRRILRYWDGIAWTGATAPAPPTTAAPDALPWWQSTWAIVLGLLLCFPVGLVGLWTRPGLTTRLRGWVTVAVALLVALAIALPGSSSGEPDATGHPGTGRTAAPDPGPTTEAPPAVEVPTLVGLTRADAAVALEAAGLTVGPVRRQPSSSPAGTVLRQQVEPGVMLGPGQQVALVVAGPLPRVPATIGASRAEALARLTAKGFRVVTTTRETTSGPDGVVLSQSPRAGKPVRPGTTIRLVIAKYRPAPPPPPRPLASSCTPGYSPCLPPASDYDCAGGSGNGPKYVEGVVKITGPDIYDLDRDGDGLGCD